jgi:membrane protein YdbS with pleckstrin-like domain
MRVLTDFLFLILAIVFLVGWLVAWAAYHVAGGLVHILLVVAIISLLLHFLRRGRSKAI